MSLTLRSVNIFKTNDWLRGIVCTLIGVSVRPRVRTGGCVRGGAGTVDTHARYQCARTLFGSVLGVRHLFVLLVMSSTTDG